jgi:hypothetical protein
MIKYKTEKIFLNNRLGGVGIKENDGGSEFNYEIRTFVNVIMYSPLQ